MIYSNDLIDFLKKKYELDGAISKYELDGKPQVFVNHPDLIQEVLQKKQRYFMKSDFYDELKHAIGDSLFTVAGGDHWLWQRRMIQPSFSKTNINAFQEDIDALASEFVATWKERNFKTQNIRIHDEFVRITLEVICRTLLGIVTTDESDIVLDNFPYILKFLGVRVFHPSPLPLDSDTPSIQRFKRSLAALDEIVAKYINDKLEKQSRNILVSDDLLTALLLQENKDGEKKLSFNEIRDHVMTQFLAGHETTATSLAYAAYFLAIHPDLQEKLASESRLEKNWWEYTNLLNFIYETLRFYPPISFMGRVAIEDVMLGNLLVKKNTSVIFSPMVIHHTSDYWEDPESFKPERFESFDFKEQKFKYLPFSEGPRVCIGRQLALMEMVLIIKNILKSYRIKPNEKTSPSYLIALTLRPKEGMPLDIERRD